MDKRETMKTLLYMGLLCMLSSFLSADTYRVEDITQEENITYHSQENGDTVAQYLLNKKGFIEWTVELDSSHMYGMDLRYALYAENPRAIWLYMDGTRVYQMDLNATGGVETFQLSKTLYKRLDEGSHTIRIVQQASSYDLAIKNFHLFSSDAQDETPASIQPIPNPPKNNTFDIEEDTPLNAPLSANVVPVIIDTDIMTDCDDAAAIGVAHALEDNGEIKILGIMLSAHDYTHNNGNTVSAINYYYNHNYDIPIGAWGALVANHGQITAQMQKKFRFDGTPYTSMHSLVKNKHTNDNILNYQRKSSLDLYRTLLQNAADHSVKIVILGASFNMARLLKYEKALVSQKVKEIIFSAWIESCNQNMCVNSGKSRSEGKRATDYIFNHLPSNVLLTVAGDARYDQRTDLYIGQSYKGTGTPMETAYSVAYHGLKYGRPYVDQIALIVAARGASNQYFKVKNYGHFESKFSTKERGYWRTNYNKNHRKLAYDEAKRVGLKSLINTLMMQKPKKVKPPILTPIALNTTIQDKWRSSIESTHRKGRYARYYTFSLSQTTKVTIDLKSSIDNYLYLLKNDGKKGSVIAKNDDGGEKRNAQIVKTLPAGTYSIEATTYMLFRKGSFSLRVSTSDKQGSKRRYDFNQNKQTDGWRYLHMTQQFGGPWNGVWYFVAKYNDPQLISPALQVDARRIKKIRIKIANDHNPRKNAILQVFWKRSDQNFYSESKSKMITISSNGGWYTYTIDLSKHPEWKGNITNIRIDPILAGDGHWIAIDYIYLEE